MSIAPDQLIGFWQHEGDEWFAFCPQGDGFRLNAREGEWSHFGFRWRQVRDRIEFYDTDHEFEDEEDPGFEVNPDYAPESIRYRRRSDHSPTGKSIEILDLERGHNWGSLYYLADAPSVLALLDQLREAGGPTQLAKKLWLADASAGFTEAAVFEISMLVIGCITAGISLSKVAPVEENLVIAVALLPAIGFLIYREHYSGSIEWWLQCPNGRKIAAVIYLAVALMAMLVGTANYFTKMPGAMAALSTLGQFLVLALCGWTAMRELRGRAHPRFEILPL
jgi:hypothetical protein